MATGNRRIHVLRHLMYILLLIHVYYILSIDSILHSLTLYSYMTYFTCTTVYIIYVNVVCSTIL